MPKPTAKLRPRRRKKKSIPGVVNANVQLPEHLHESMKAIRQRRRELEQEDVKLCRIYREAVEQYVNAEPQQKLLSGEPEALRRTA